MYCNTKRLIERKSILTLTGYSYRRIASINDIKITINKRTEEFGDLIVHPPPAAAGGESQRPCEAGAQHQKELLFHKNRVDVYRTQLADIVAE